jgi:hypothetical protein
MWTGNRPPISMPGHRSFGYEEVRSPDLDDGPLEMTPFLASNEDDDLFELLGPDT